MKHSPSYDLARLRELARPSVEAWQIFWPLDADQRREMTAMLASYGEMLLKNVEHDLRAALLPSRPDAHEPLTQTTDPQDPKS